MPSDGLYNNTQNGKNIYYLTENDSDHNSLLNSKKKILLGEADSNNVADSMDS